MQHLGSEFGLILSDPNLRRGAIRAAHAQSVRTGRAAQTVVAAQTLRGLASARIFAAARGLARHTLAWVRSSVPGSSPRKAV